ncbi:hypothetical protein [Vibrio sp. 10N.239.312.D08]|uniref:hypothetical protein n=1 Tax=Vibrio sp. 10N.239.312.D08 TaxID=3229978 RepID=UPI00354C8E98
MSVPHKTELEWSGNIGSIEYTNNQCLKLSIGSNRTRSEQGTSTAWMTVIFTKGQTNTFGPKFAVGDALHVKGDLSLSTYQNVKTTTLFVRQVIEHEPKGVRYLAKLHTTAAKLGNQQVLNFLRDEVQLHNLFWHMMGQMFPGTPMPQQLERQNKNQAPAPINNAAPVQQQQTHTQQQSYAPQPEQPVQQQSYAPQPEQPVQQQSYAPQPEQQVQPQTYTPQPEHPVSQQQARAQQPTQVQAEPARAPVQQNVQVKPNAQTQNSVQQLGQVDISSLPQGILDQIMNYQSEGGAPLQSGTPDFLNNPEMTVPDAVKAHAHEIASAELQNTENFFKHQ